MKVDANIATPQLSPSLSEGAKNTQSESSRSAAPLRTADGIVLDDSLKRAVQKQKKDNERQQGQDIAREIYKYHAVFAVDDDKNVVVRLIDKKGKTIQQFPPEEYLEMKKQFRENIKNLFSIEA